MGGIFGGGKGGGTQASPPEMPDNSAALQQQEQMMQMMMGMMEGLMSQSMSMQMPEMPTVETPLPDRAPVVDWTEKQDQLNAKMKADYNTERARMKGRTDTVLTSPLLDDEDPEITDSILASGENA